MSSIFKSFAKILVFLSLFAVFFTAQINAQAKFDYDQRVDLGVFRPSENIWYSHSSETQSSTATRWGLSTDLLVPADYDGDGLTDLAVWRPETGVWYILRTRDGQIDTVNWGTTTSVPNGFVLDEPVPADYDGDGNADFAVWRPSTGIWYILKSLDGYNPEYATYFRWGKLGDIPVPADYDGDGKTDFAVFRSTENRWYVYQSGSGAWKTSVFGQAGADALVPADYTGDRKADFAVYRGGTWFIEDSRTNEIYSSQFGLSADVPVPADYNGDGQTDLAVFRNGVWYVFEINNPTRFKVFNYGKAGDIPISSFNVKPSIVPIP